MKLEKYSIGVGDRFGMEGVAQLRALQMAVDQGFKIVPVWNKSNREHSIIGSSPQDVRRAVEDSVKVCGWTASYYVDADHIGIATVDKFLASSDFYTIDVADFIGKQPDTQSRDAFMVEMKKFRGSLSIPGVASVFDVTEGSLKNIADKYLVAIEEAGRVYRTIADKKGAGRFIAEISIDEADKPQTPIELFFILAAIARERIPIQTIAPKFTGSFLKGIDYVGDIHQFTREFEDDLAVVRMAVKTFNLPENLKLSVHSGSDKFSLYPIMHRAMEKFNAGLHLKTAGTTWLEEVIGLAASGGEGLNVAKEIYRTAYARREELCNPYRTVIAIDESLLPDPREVETWSASKYVDALRHVQTCKGFNREFRQLIHVGYKVAAEMGPRFRRLLESERSEIEQNVTLNIYARHIVPLFLGKQPEGMRSGPPRHNKRGVKV